MVAVGNGQEAIDRMADDPPDIVLADVGMPLLDGYAVASFVRNHDALRDVPVLLLVGAFDPVDDERVQVSGAAGILVKPFEPSLVISRVKELLGLAGRPLQPTTLPTSPEKATVVPEPTVSANASAIADFEPGWTEGTSRDASLGSPAKSRGTAGEVADNGQFSIDALWAEATVALASPLHAAHAPSRPDASVADAFTALLAAEQGESGAPVEAASPSEDQVEVLISEVARRVAEQLGTAAVREHVDRIVSEVAERLVREEIARIRGAVSARQG
ncbi:MAG: response regulator [Acidobacteria bacterium]|nr:response regulator [Acidobacteriota bacterium]